jgi:hypothetical protein
MEADKRAGFAIHVSHGHTELLVSGIPIRRCAMAEENVLRLFLKKLKLSTGRTTRGRSGRNMVPYMQTSCGASAIRNDIVAATLVAQRACRIRLAY